MKNIRVLILILIASTSLLAQSENRRRQELADEKELQKVESQLKFYMEELEKVKIKRWQDKRNSVARKEAFSEAWEELRREMDQYGQRKSQKDASLLRLDNQLAQMEMEIKGSEGRLKDFGIQISEKAADLIKVIDGGFPWNNDEQISKLRSLQSRLEALGYRPSADAIHLLFNIQKSRFAIGETAQYERSKLAFKSVTPSNPAPGLENSPVDNPGIIAGYRIRIGSIYQAFISTESPDAAILARSGNLGDKPWVWIEKIPKDTKDALHLVKQSIIVGGDTLKPVLIPIDVILRKSTGKGYAAEEESSWFKALQAEWVGAGFVIWFILGIVIIAFAIVGEKVVLVLFRGLGSGRIYNKARKFVDAGDIQGALLYVRRKKNATANILTVILEKAKGERHEAEESAFATMLHQTPLFERNINTINILAGAAPLVGLLGTVSGMINLFAAITMHGTNDPKIMAAGIAEALLSTKWGLIVALPLMLIYNLTSNLVAKAISDMEKYSASMINALFEKKHV